MLMKGGIMQWSGVWRGIKGVAWTEELNIKEKGLKIRALIK